MESGPTCKIETDNQRPAESVLPDRPAFRASQPTKVGGAPDTGCIKCRNDQQKTEERQTIHLGGGA